MATQPQSTFVKSNSHSIDLTAELDNGVVKIFSSNLTDPVHLPKNTGRHHFTFHLTDKTFPSMGVRFCTVAEGLLDVDESTDCPPKNPGINTDQVDPNSVRRPNAKTAMFTDNNSGAERTLSYALHFKCDDPGQDPIFDPEIRNGGGTIPAVGDSWNALLIGAGVAALAIVAYFLFF